MVDKENGLSWSSLIASSYWWVWLIVIGLIGVIILVGVVLWVDVDTEVGFAGILRNYFDPAGGAQEKLDTLDLDESDIRELPIPLPGYTVDQSRADAVAHMVAYMAWCEDEPDYVWHASSQSCTYNRAACERLSNESYVPYPKDAWGVPLYTTTSETRAQEPWLRFMQGGCYNVSWEKEMHDYCEKHFGDKTSNESNLATTLWGGPTKHVFSNTYSPPAYACAGVTCRPGAQVLEDGTVDAEEGKYPAHPTCVIYPGYCDYVGLEYKPGPKRHQTNADGRIVAYNQSIGDCYVHGVQAIIENVFGITFTRKVRTQTERLIELCKEGTVESSLRCFQITSNFGGMMALDVGAVMAEDYARRIAIECSENSDELFNSSDQLLECIWAVIPTSVIFSALYPVVSGLLGMACDAMGDQAPWVCELARGPSDIRQFPMFAAKTVWQGPNDWFKMMGTQPVEAQRQLVLAVRGPVPHVLAFQIMRAGIGEERFHQITGLELLETHTPQLYVALDWLWQVHVDGMEGGPFYLACQIIQAIFPESQFVQIHAERIMLIMTAAYMAGPFTAVLVTVALYWDDPETLVVELAGAVEDTANAIGDAIEDLWNDFTSIF
jgi:hypothetical protein